MRLDIIRFHGKLYCYSMLFRFATGYWQDHFIIFLTTGIYVQKNRPPCSGLHFRCWMPVLWTVSQPLPGLADILFCFLSAVGCCSLFLPHLQCGAAGVHSGNQLWHTGSLQFLFRSIVRPSGSSLFLRFFWWIMYFCADKKCTLSCRNQDTVIYCWSSVSGSSVVSSVSSFTEAVSGASSWRLLMMVS